MDELTTSHQQLISRLIAGAKQRTLSSRVLSWRFGSVSSEMAALARGRSHEQYLTNATVAKMFAILHAGRPHISTGMKDRNIGDTLRSVGYHSDPMARRLYERLLSASRLVDLHDVLVDIAKQLRVASRGQQKPWMVPNWSLLLDDLTQWLDSTQRDEVRLRWALQFLTWSGESANNADNDAADSAAEETATTKKKPVPERGPKDNETMASGQQLHIDL